MAAVGLANLLDSQQETNKELGLLNDRFNEFFRQSARDKLDLMEMFREMMGGGKSGAPAPAAAGTTPSTTGGGGGGLFGGFGIASAIGSAIAALALNSLGAYWSENFGKTLKSMGTKIADFAKTTGEKVTNTFAKARENLGKKLDDLGKKMGEFGKKIGDAAKSARGFVSEKAGKIGSALSGVGASVKSFFGGGVSAGQKITTASGSVATTTGAKVAPGFVQLVGEKGNVFTMKEDTFKAAGGRGVGAGAMGAKVRGIGSKVMNSKIMGGAKKILPQVAIATSAYDAVGKAGVGTNQANDALGVQNPAAGAALAGASGVGYFGSAMIGGLADFAKLITVDAVIEAGQRLGAFDQNGLAQRIQEGSVQNDLFDPLVDTARTKIAESLTQETAAANIGSMGGQIVIAPTNNNQTNNTTTMGSGTAAVASPVVNNGTRSAYEGA